MEYTWYHLKKEETLEKLKSSRRGLSENDVQERLVKHGQNTLPEERPPSVWALILRQLKSSLVYILLIAAIISFALGDFIDGQVILAAVVLNVIVGFFQENRAQKALRALHRVVRFEALVLRDGEELLVPAEALVPGDIMVLKTGSRIPADGRLLQAIDLTVNESILTGESYPVPKGVKELTGRVVLPEQSNMVFLGTTLAQGTGVAVVTATGLETEIGKIAILLRETKEDPTPLQTRLRAFSRFLGTAIVIIALLLFLFGVSVGKELVDIFSISVAVAVAAIPEGLLVAVTVILAIGMQRILKRRALARKLLAAETLGSATVICTDKTGTLTEGDMSVVRIVTEASDVGFSRSEKTPFGQKQDSSTRFALEIGVLCNDAHIEHEEEALEQRVVTGNPTERALIIAAHAVGLTRQALSARYPRLDTIPFDSERKHMVTLHAQEHGDHVVLAKGAPEKILGVCTTFDKDGAHHRMTDERREELLKASERMSREGLRVIAIAHRHVSRDKRALAELGEPLSDMIFVSLVALKDPLREGAKETVHLCKSAGIRTVMITGDHKLTARKIAEELGLPSEPQNILSGDELAALSDYDLEKRIRDISVYARVTPKDKLRIIDAWQEKGEVVAMTGDGVNDAPALKSANIGIALGSGTDVAKEAADVVLLDNNFRTILAAVEQGRVIYENIRKVVLYLLTDSFSEVILIAVSLFATVIDPSFPIPLLAAQILWINLVTDGFPNIALTVEPEEAEIMKEPPRDPKESLFTSEMKWLVGVVSVVSALLGLSIFLLTWHTNGDLSLARTATFAALGVDSLVYVFSVRVLRHSVLHVNPFANRSLLLAVLGGVLLQLAAIYAAPLQTVLGTVALGFREWTLVLTASFITLCSVEIVKAIFRKTRNA